MELATRGAFSVTAAALQTQTTVPQWSLAAGRALHPVRERTSCNSTWAPLARDLRSTAWRELLRDWDCPSFLLVAGGSSILAGDAPKDTAGWSCGLGDDNAPQRFFLAHASLSGSGLAVKGSHILDPRTGQPALRQNRAWALADTAAESDALSTACMVLTEQELVDVLATDPSWLVFIENGEIIHTIGNRALPPLA